MDTETYFKVIGTNIKRLRGNMKQTDFVKKAKISRTVLSNIENGKNIGLGSLLKIAAALKVHPTDLFLTEDDKKAFNFKSKKIIDRLYEALGKED